MFGGPMGPMGGGPGMGGPMGGRFHGGMDSDTTGNSKITYIGVVKRLPRYLKTVKLWMSMGAFGTILNSVTSILTPLMVMWATNDIVDKKVDALTYIAIGYVGLALAGWLGQYMQMFFLAMAGQSTLYKMRTQMFDHLHLLSLSFFDNNKVGKVMSRVQNDVDQLQNLVSNDIITLMANIITIVAIGVIMVAMNVRLGLITFSVIPIMLVIMFIWHQHAHMAFTRARRSIAVVNDQLQEDVSGIRVTQGLTREDTNRQNFDSVNRKNLDANVIAAKMQAFMMPISQIMTNGAYALVLVIGGFQVLGHTMEIGTLLAFLLYVQRFTQPVQQIAMQYTMINNSMASGVRIFELLDIKPEITDRPDAVEMPTIKGGIQFKDVSFAYEPDVWVLKDINLTIKPGETVAIAGQTGAGKSSLTSLIDRFYDVQKGEVLIDGYNVKNVTQESLRKQISIVPQDPFLFSGTIKDNIKYGCPDATDEEVVNAATAADAHDFISRLERGYDTTVGERGGSLSAGQRQLICMARAILADPRILIMDEATSNIDTNTERIMQASLKKVGKGRTVVIIAHRLSTITNADRIIVLQYGSIIEVGNHEELMAKQGRYYQMYRSLSAAAAAS